MLRHIHHTAGRVLGGDFLARRDEVDAAHGLVVLAHVVVALGAAAVVVEGDAGADHVDEGRATVGHGALDQRHQLLLVARETACHVSGAQLQCDAHQVHRAVAVDHALLALGAAVGRGRELALGQAVDAVVLDDVGHAHAAPHGVGELAQADGGRITVARDAQVEQVAVGQVGAGERRGHAAVHGVEAVRGAQEVVGRLAAATNAAELGHAVGLDVELPAGLDDGGRDAVVPAARAQCGDPAFVVAPRVADLVDVQAGVVQLGFGDVGHAASLTW